MRHVDPLAIPPKKTVLIVEGQSFQKDRPQVRPEIDRGFPGRSGQFGDRAAVDLQFDPGDRAGDRQFDGLDSGQQADEEGDETYHRFSVTGRGKTGSVEQRCGAFCTQAQDNLRLAGGPGPKGRASRQG